MRTWLIAVVLVLAGWPVRAQNFDAVVKSLHEERAKYGATMNDDECAELVNAVAWKHRDEGWGLSGKNFGTHGTLHDGTQVAHDILHYRPTNKIWDVLTGAGAHSTPIRAFGPGGPPPGSNRPWVAPVAPVGAVTPPVTPVTPPVTPPPSSDLGAKLNELIGHVAALTATVAALRETVAGQATQLDILVNQRLTEDWAARVWAATDPERPPAALPPWPTYRGCARLLGCVTLNPQ
jgi:hypothetical protein